MRCVRALFLAVLVGLAVGATAQTIHCVPRKDCSNGVQFLPTQAEYVAAVGGTLRPTSPSTPIDFQVQPEIKNAYDLEVSRSPWSQATTMVLEARYTFSGPHLGTTVRDWASTSTVPNNLLTDDVNKTDVSVEYRVRIDGTEAPGIYTTTVSYQTTGANGPPNHGIKVRDTVMATISVTIPSYVSLLLNGVPVGQTASVEFNYALSNLADYVKAIQSGVPLSMTTSNFKSLAVATNDPHGYRVDVTVVEMSGPPNSSLNVSDILLFGAKTANGHIFSSAKATDGYVTLLIPSDFGVHVDGGEAAGTYNFTVTYVAQPNP